MAREGVQGPGWAAWRGTASQPGSACPAGHPRAARRLGWRPPRAARCAPLRAHGGPSHERPPLHARVHWRSSLVAAPPPRPSLCCSALGAGRPRRAAGRAAGRRADPGQRVVPTGCCRTGAGGRGGAPRCGRRAPRRWMVARTMRAGRRQAAACAGVGAAAGRSPPRSGGHQQRCRAWVQSLQGRCPLAGCALRWCRAMMV
mmetsp:Transcript_10397/g.26447  ORF Transcript_10397/g.26447 Transcript_10397/m.26447 type:complete len:201 (+) Transcript_10397:1440-2042(+)